MDNILFPLLPGDVAVLCGGPGAEREVSLASGSEVHAALGRAGLEARLVTVPEKNPEDFLETLDCGLAVMMLHGEFGEDGGAQEILERRGLAYTGSGPEACRLAMDKAAVKALMRDAGVPTPRWALVRSAAEAEAGVRTAGLLYPLFVKPNSRGSSVGVTRVDSPASLAGAVERALACGCDALIEEMAAGREMTVGWLDGRVLPVIEMEAAGGFYDYHSKYESGETRYHCPADLSEELAEEIRVHTEEIVRIVGARDLARVDFILTESGPRFLELNALPGFTSHSLVPLAASRIGLPMERLCLSLVAMAAERGLPRLKVLSSGDGEGEDEDESEIIDFHHVNWKLVGV